MSTVPPPRSKTIDNLGMDPSIRYALDQTYLDKSLSTDTSYISSQANIDVTAPYFSSEFDAIFQTSLRNKGWALFMYPPGFRDQRKRLFTFQLLPSLGTEETVQMHAQRLKERVDKEKERRRHKKRQNTHQDDAFEEEIQLAQAEEESQKILRLITMICQLDKILIEINARRNQYQKG